MLARHVSDLTDPSSGAFYKLYVQIWYVVVRLYLVGLHIYYAGITFRTSYVFQWGRDIAPVALILY